MATPQEDVMPMPLDVVQASAGVAVDIGKDKDPPGTPVSSTRIGISSSSFHRLDMTLVVDEALNPNKPNQTKDPILGL